MGRVLKAIKLICLSGNIIIVKVVPTSAVLEYLIVILCLQGSAGSCHLNRGVIWVCLRWNYSHPIAVEPSWSNGVDRSHVWQKYISIPDWIICLRAESCSAWLCVLSLLSDGAIGVLWAGSTSSSGRKAVKDEFFGPCRRLWVAQGQVVSLVSSKASQCLRSTVVNQIPGLMMIQFCNYPG